MAKILLADNEPGFLTAGKKILGDLDYQVVTADNPDAAWRVVKEQRPDLALLDVRLADDNDDYDTSGITLARKIQEESPQTSIVLISGRVSASQIKDLWPAAAKGHLAFVAKSEGAEVMVKTVESALQQAKKGQVDIVAREYRRRIWGLVAFISMGLGIIIGLFAYAITSADVLWIGAGFVLLATFIYFGIQIFGD